MSDDNKSDLDQTAFTDSPAVEGELMDDRDGQETPAQKPGLLARLFGKKPPQDPNDPDLRGGLLSPFAKRDQAITSLSRGFDTLSDLMESIRDQMERSTDKQTELLETLKHLPRSVEEAAEANKLHGQTLGAIRTQLDESHRQGEKLGEILGTIGETGEQQRRSLDTMAERMGKMSEQDEQIADNLTGVGNLIRGVSDQNAQSVSVLRDLQKEMNRRSDELESQMKRQSGRFVTLLVLSLLLSLLALAAVAGLGYLLLSEAGYFERPATDDDAGSALVLPADADAATTSDAEAAEILPVGGVADDLPAPTLPSEINGASPADVADLAPTDATDDFGRSFLDALDGIENE